MRTPRNTKSFVGVRSSGEEVFHRWATFWNKIPMAVRQPTAIMSSTYTPHKHSTERAGNVIPSSLDCDSPSPCVSSTLCLCWLSLSTTAQSEGCTTD
eukprot:2958458-Amphidinium_carterae.1